MGNGALNEGLADVFAYALTNDLQLGEGWFKNGSTVRDYNSPNTWSQMSSEAHHDGEVIAGAYIKFGQQVGIPRMMEILEQVMALHLDSTACYPYCNVSSTRNLYTNIFNATLDKV